MPTGPTTARKRRSSGADLAQKKMSPEHGKIMDELVREHIHGRELVRKLVEAKDL